MVPTFAIKQGDLLPVLRGQYIDPKTGVPMDLTGWTLLFNLRRKDTGVVLVTRAAAVDTDPLYFVFAWQGTETAVAGSYEAEVSATKSGKRLTIPTAAPMVVEIYPALVP